MAGFRINFSKYEKLILWFMEVIHESKIDSVNTIKAISVLSNLTLKLSSKTWVMRPTNRITVNSPVSSRIGYRGRVTILIIMATCETNFINR